MYLPPGFGTKDVISLSRLTTMASVGVCTRPTDSTSDTPGVTGFEGIKPGQVHTDEPVSLAPALAGIIQQGCFSPEEYCSVLPSHWPHPG